MPPDPDIRLVLRPLPDDVPVEVRLRQLLKVALRRFRLKGVSVETARPEPENPEKENG
jgi:hypothetical protein